VWRQTPSDFYDFWCMKSWGNLTAEDYKFTHLTCILWPHYLEKCKKSFATMLFMCFRMFRLLLNKIDYSCHSAAVREVTSFKRCSKWSPSAWTQLRSLLCHCSIASPTMATMLSCNSVHVSTSRCRNLTTIHIPGYTLMHHAQDAIIYNLNQDSRMATCYGLKN